jgi:hypothetical protein
VSASSGGQSILSTSGANKAFNVGTTDSNDLRFQTDSAERMRIDSSGNLLVGKTDTLLASAGVAIYSDPYKGLVEVTRDSGQAMILNRKTNDGAIIDLRKDGATVGSIGSINGDNLRIGGSATNHAGLQFGTNIIYPESGPSSNITDGLVDLGNGSGRFKDLYLQGGVYLGGTGSDNKLDDYEEGTKTLGSVAGITATTNEVTGFYTKIGRLVTETIKVVISGKSGGAGNPAIPLSFAPTTNVLTSSFQGGSIGLNTIVSAAYFGVYGLANQVYANTLSGGYIWHSSWSDGTLVFTVIYEA